MYVLFYTVPPICSLWFKFSNHYTYYFLILRDNTHPVKLPTYWLSSSSLSALRLFPGFKYEGNDSSYFICLMKAKLGDAIKALKPA